MSLDNFFFERYELISENKFRDKINGEEYEGMEEAIKILNECNDEKTKSNIRLDMINDMVDKVSSRMDELKMLKYE